MSPYQPPGIEFYSQTYGKRMLLVTDGPGKDWIAYKHPDGQWVSLRKATEADRQELEQAQETMNKKGNQ